MPKNLEVSKNHKQTKHAPQDCPSANHRHYQRSDWRARDRFDNHFDAFTYKWCKDCDPSLKH